MKFGILVSFLFLTVTGATFGASRFPQPDFETHYSLPATQAPAPPDYVFEYLDVILLLLTLSLASYFILKKRSRKWIFALMSFSLLYFGFYRQGCICPIGSIQNVTQALFDSGYAVPISVIAFFVLPLLFSLLFGRVFCAAVCPLGALQDMMVLKPVKVQLKILEHMHIYEIQAAIMLKWKLDNDKDTQNYLKMFFLRL